MREGLRLGDGRAHGLRGDASVRRLWLQSRVPRSAVLARRSALLDLRGHGGSPIRAHREAFAGRFAFSASRYAEIRLAYDGPVASLVLARPEARNAMTHTMGAEIRRAVDEFNGRDDVRV